MFTFQFIQHEPTSSAKARNATKIRLATKKKKKKKNGVIVDNVFYTSNLGDIKYIYMLLGILNLKI